MNRATIEKTYRQYISCLNERRIDEAEAHYADRLLYNGAKISRAEWRGTAIESTFIAMPDLRWQIERLVIDDAVLAAQLKDTATLVRPWNGFGPTGQRISFGENVFYRYENGLIVEVNSIVDVLAMRERV